ncbi:TY-Chap domain-containing protein [Gordonia sp. NPDC003950]
MRTNDFDSSIEDAWREFRDRLADVFRRLSDGENSRLQVNGSTPEHPAGRLTITVTGAHRVRITVNADDLDGSLDRRLLQVEQLRTLGWRRLRNGSYIIEGSRARADDLAAVTVDTVRQVWEAIHPSFLAAPFLPRSPEPEATLRVGTAPHDADHLRSLIHTMLETAAGRTIDLDEDGDLPLPTRPYPSWLRVCEAVPCIEVFTVITDKVIDPAHAATVIAAQPTDHAAIRLLLRGRTVVAQRIIDAAVFVPENINTALNDWFTFVEYDGPRIARLATTREKHMPATDSDSDEEGPLPDALLAILHLDPDNATLSAHEVAEICEYDRSEVLRCIRICEEQEVSWDRSAAEADGTGATEERDACRHEARSWAATSAKLRAALRIVVLPSAGRRRIRPIA